MGAPKPRQVDLTCHADDRGFLCQMYEGYEFPGVKRIYVVGNFSKNIIRGFHKHNYEWKAYFVTSGAAKFVVVNETREISEYTLSDRNPSVLIVPPKYSHGWVSLSENTILVGISNRTLEESMADDFREDPLVFGRAVWEPKAR